MMQTTLIIISFIVGLFLRPLVSKWIKETFARFLPSKIKRYEIIFKIEFYSRPSIHHVGEEGMLVKSESIKIQIDAETSDEALSILELVVKQEVKSELVAIKEISTK